MATLRTVAFHSYKGGTGKTTLISNIAALFAKQGFNVALLDFDMYAPSLGSYYKKKPNLYINDLLSGEAKISQIVHDLSDELDLQGKFLVGFSSSRKEDVNKIEVMHDSKWQIEAVRRVIASKQDLIDKYKIDYLFLDTSPGIRYWSINTIAASDYIFLLLKDSDMDIEGTRKMINDIYDSLCRHGGKYYILLNKVPGETISDCTNEKTWIAELERVIGAEIIGCIPCYCDIQFSRHEFLFSIRQPTHPFSTRLSQVANTIKTLCQPSLKK
jgi:chromosome partitioning protein